MVAKPNPPWVDVPEIWKDEKAFLNWLRSQTRRAWARHPLKHAYCNQRPTYTRINAVEEGLINEDQYTRCKKLRSCEMCDHWFPVSSLEVDHIVGGEGFEDLDSYLEWYWRMLHVGFDSIRELCKDCHADVTLSQRLHCSLEDVPMQRERIEFSKLKAGPQRKLLSKLGLPDGRNEEIRIAIHLEYLEKKYAKS